MYAFVRFSLLCVATSFPLLCQDESIWLVGQVSWQALATGESVYVPKVLTGTQCAEDHAELLARETEGGREEVQQERWEKGRWSGGRGGLSWRTDTY